MNTHEVWICGEILPEGWGLVGVFSTEKKAVEQCRNSDYFVAPIIIDKVASEKIMEFPYSYFPTTE